MDSFTHHSQIMKFTLPEPDPRNVCNFCGGSGSKDNLIQGKAANICFECSDLAKEIADEKRKELAEKEIKEIARLIEGYAVKTDSADIASLLHQAGYRKVE
ncbi:ClpX C4-type zinc finger protein [Proteus vulgaris]|uniref:ClpX C4-type zinc finger protein n=2 Tax=Proteus vulgaris TaxID=585 RepID=UPI0034DDAA9B